MFVRTGGEGDLAAVSRLIKTVFHSTFDGFYGAATVDRLTGDFYSVAGLRRFMERQRSEFLVVDDGERLGGVAFGGAMGDDARIVLLDLLVVATDLQGRGIGGMLLDEFESSFFESELVRLETEARNLRAVRFFQAADYRETGSALATVVPTTILTFEKSLLPADI
ncbi:MAG: GNAT family N-acetyltransferase [Mesorhizobium sp.]